MQLNTKHFGVIEIDEKGIINFPDGIPGFEGVKKFVLVPDEEDSPFNWLQGVDNTELAFAVIDPKVLMPDYEVDVDDTQVEVLNIKNANNIIVLSIVVVPEDITKISANLKAPILINPENNIGKQVVVDRSEYQIRYYIIEKLRRMGGNK